MAICRNEHGKIIAHRFTIEQIEEAMECYQGFCLACGESRDECEPDARKYHCDSCDLDYVYGAEELVLMGFVS